LSGEPIHPNYCRYILQSPRSITLNTSTVNNSVEIEIQIQSHKLLASFSGPPGYVGVSCLSDPQPHMEAENTHKFGNFQ